MKPSTMLPFGFANKHNVLMIESDSGVAIYYSDETPLQALGEVNRHISGIPVFEKKDADTLKSEITQHYKSADTSLDSINDLHETVQLDELNLDDNATVDLLDSQDDAPVIRIINALFTQALKQKASDIHIETFENSMSVRIRVDGVLQEILQPDHRWAPRLISRIKVMAKLDIAEKRVPQDGRVSLRMAGQALDVRVSTMPSIHGERVVLRLLEKHTQQLELTQLGMPDSTRRKLVGLLNQPNGIILVTGPTGSGKTTTLYAGLTLLNEKSRNILTVEDPVEYALEGIGQTPVNTKTGMSFAKGLKAILRQDPDVVMIGEIRDAETAQIAVQASLTGHLVLSTLHTNDALGAITRLTDIGVEPYLISSSLKGVLAQRLIRTLCPHCKEATTLSSTDADRLGNAKLAGQPICQPKGCDECNHTGYAGRLGLYELLQVTPELARNIHSKVSEHDLKGAIKSDHRSMLDEGISAILKGESSVNEVLRMVKDASDHAFL
ncbi:type II secretion system ATPase GspE [Neptuniibacter sp. PT8_73]|uniref:type II secretion system ATPase GspE n=1 Tax=unclassified Neptuniibacter TaxID=2630693 RepID=UPI0039F69E87